MSASSSVDDVQPIRDCIQQQQQQQQQQHVPSTSAAPCPQHTLPGFCLGWCESKRYTVQEVIGKGSYGVVFAAIDTTTGARVAIKKIQSVFDNVADATRILREIKLLRLLKHPGGLGRRQGVCRCMRAWHTVDVAGDSRACDRFEMLVCHQT
eukprot:1137298-Pelagomonas_calceolata.AAC.9